MKTKYISIYKLWLINIVSAHINCAIAFIMLLTFSEFLICMTLDMYSKVGFSKNNFELSSEDFIYCIIYILFVQYITDGTLIYVCNMLRIG